MNVKAALAILAALALSFLTACTSIAPAAQQPSQQATQQAAEQPKAQPQPSVQPTHKAAPKAPKAAAPKAQPKVPTSVKAQPKVEEDDPQWDCATMGHRICGQQPARIVSMVDDALNSFCQRGTTTLYPGQTFTYVRTDRVSLSQPLTASQISVPSVTMASTFHVFQRDVQQPKAAAPKPCLSCEAASFQNYNYIPMDELTNVTYLGTSAQDRTNGDDIYSVRSKLVPSLWHSYRIVAKQQPKPQTVDCDNLQLGQAHAGIMLTCYKQEAQQLYKGSDFNGNYLGSGFTAPAGTAYVIPSVKYGSISHFFK